MTPEKAAYYRLMLMAGLREQYDHDIDEALERENPITIPLLDLACHMSDLNQTISILADYIVDNKPNEQQVFSMVVQELRRLYTDGSLSIKDIIEIMYIIAKDCETEGNPVWDDFSLLYYDYEMVESNFVSEEQFQQAFETWLFRGERLNLWEVIESNQPQKQNIFADFIRKMFRKEKRL